MLENYKRRVRAVALIVCLGIGLMGFGIKTRTWTQKPSSQAWVALSVSDSTVLLAVTPSYVACRLDTAAAKNVRIGPIASPPSAGAGYALQPGQEWVGHWINAPIFFIADSAGAVNVWCYYETS